MAKYAVTALQQKDSWRQGCIVSISKNKNCVLQYTAAVNKATMNNEAALLCSTHIHNTKGATARNHSSRQQQVLQATAPARPAQRPTSNTLYTAQQAAHSTASSHIRSGKLSTTAVFNQLHPTVAGLLLLMMMILTVCGLCPGLGAQVGPRPVSEGPPQH